jgi:hypothetical protein
MYLNTELAEEWLKAEEYWRQYKGITECGELQEIRELQYRMAASNFFLKHLTKGNTVCRNCATIMHKSLLVNHLCRQCNADNLANTEE